MTIANVFSLLALFCTSAFAAPTPTIEYYWGFSTEIAKKDPDHVSTELFIGTRTYEAEKKTVVDDQWALSAKGEDRPQTYKFNLADKKLEVFNGEKKVGEGTLKNYTEKSGRITQLKYQYKTADYEYEGKDQPAYSGKIKDQANAEEGTVTADGKKYTFAITYHHISKEQYTALLKRVFPAVPASK